MHLSLVPFALLLLVTQQVQLCRCSRFDPHEPDQAFRSWFEGWYLRVVPDAERSDTNAPSSFGVITGCIPRGQPAWNSTLIQIMVQPKLAKQARYEVDLNEQLRVLASGEAVHGDPSPKLPANFSITAPNSSFQWRMDGDTCRVHVRYGRLNFTVTCVGQPVSWDSQGEGPEGEPSSSCQPGSPSVSHCDLRMCEQGAVDCVLLQAGCPISPRA